LTTVTRAYTEAERRGLVSGEVGRGTYVRRQETFGLRSANPSPSAIDLTINNLPPFELADELLRSASRVLGHAESRAILEYQPHHGSPRHREAGASFLSGLGRPATADRVLVTAGAQHAMAVVFSTIVNPGDLVLTGEVTYSGMKSLANFLHVRLRGLAMDDEGIRPEALEAALATTDAKALYCMPTLQNPTGAVMSDARRRDVVAIAEQYDVAVVEDDSYGFLLPRQKTLASFGSRGEKFYYLTGTAKSLAPGLRVGFILAPRQMVDRLAASISATTIMAPAPMAELVSHWVADGTADRSAAEGRVLDLRSLRLSRPPGEPSRLAHHSRAPERQGLRRAGAHARRRDLTRRGVHRGSRHERSCRSHLPWPGREPLPARARSSDHRRRSRYSTRSVPRSRVSLPSPVLLI
jgi:DNA-binding transcriptional MocR family regulator